MSWRWRGKREGEEGEYDRNTLYACMKISK
jgi:hypothetical protein